MATARELLEQADALMRRNRTRQIDTEIPELTDAIATPVIAPESPPTPVALDDIPELTDAVEEIEIESIVEIPEDEAESNTWLRADAEALAAELDPSRAAAASQPRVPEPIGGRVLPLFAIAGKSHEPAVVAHVAAAVGPIVAAMSGGALAKAPVVELPHRDAVPAHGADAEHAPKSSPPPNATVTGFAAMDAKAREVEAAARNAESAASGDQPAAHDAPARSPPDSTDWVRWQALAEEIRMQVLQRIDIFTDAGLRDQLAMQMRPIVERASAEMVETINAQVGELLRAYIAEAIEREIDKWREGNP